MHPKHEIVVVERSQEVKATAVEPIEHVFLLKAGMDDFEFFIAEDESTGYCVTRTSQTRASRAYLPKWLVYLARCEVDSTCPHWGATTGAKK